MSYPTCAALMPYAGQIIDGKYCLESFLAQGGMGAVWTARHVVLGRTFAVKFLKAPDEAPVHAERFLREARMAASVQHRAVVSLFDFGTTEDGELFMVMEHLAGESLERRLGEAPPLSVRTLCATILEALGGLAAVHEQGIVHRDLKPENIFLVREREGVYPKLLDFGISKPGEGADEETGAAPLTGTGFAVGTPVYMSPEQVRGQRDLDPRTDLYAIGVLLYRAATGVFPFSAPSAPELMVRIVAHTPPRVVTLRPALGEAFSALVMKALARDRTERFGTAAELRHALEAVIPTLPEHEPVAWPLRQEVAVSEDSLVGAPPKDTPSKRSGRSVGGSSRVRLRRLVPAFIAAAALLLAFALLAGDRAPAPHPGAAPGRGTVARPR